MNNDERTKRYLATDGMRCPYCDSANIVPDSSYDAPGGEGRLSINVTCSHCGQAWTDEYTLTGVTYDDDN